MFVTYLHVFPARARVVGQGPEGVHRQLSRRIGDWLLVRGGEGAVPYNVGNGRKKQLIEVHWVVWKYTHGALETNKYIITWRNTTVSIVSRTHLVIFKLLAFEWPECWQKMQDSGFSCRRTQWEYNGIISEFCKFHCKKWKKKKPEHFITICHFNIQLNM